MFIPTKLLCALTTLTTLALTVPACDEALPDDADLRSEAEELADDEADAADEHHAKAPRPAAVELLGAGEDEPEDGLYKKCVTRKQCNDTCEAKCDDELQCVANCNAECSSRPTSCGEQP